MTAGHDWERFGVCTETNVPFHYGQPGYDAKVCKEMCARCPAAIACLAQAMADEAALGGYYRFGIRGGLTATERTELSITDDRYAIYPTDLTELEVRTIFQEVVADMRAKFVHSVDSFEGGEIVDLNKEMADTYVGSGHAFEVDADGKPVKAAKAAAKPVVPKPAATVDEPGTEPSPKEPSKAAATKS